MDIMQCITMFLQASESASVINLPMSLTVNGFLFVVYLVVSVVTKRAVFMIAFFISYALFNLGIFDQLSEASLYLITFAIYSYVIFCNGLTLKTRIAYGILLILSITLAYDAYFYGYNGVYGASETLIYDNIEHLALYSHTFLISTLIPYRRIKDGFRRFIDTILLVSRNSAYFMPI